MKHLGFRLIRQIQCLVDPHRVHVGSQEHGLPAAPEIELRQQVVSLREGNDLGRLELFQSLTDVCGSPNFLVGSFGHAM